MMPNTYWDLFAGYTVFWFAFVVFGWRLVRDQSNLAHQLADLEEKLARVSGSTSDDSDAQ